jgi:hypothetical protein
VNLDCAIHCLHYGPVNDNGGKQADVADTTEKFCTKMCVFSACSALKLSTNVIE